MQASDEQGGNRGLLKAELKNVFGKPQPKVAGSHQEVVGNKKNDVAYANFPFVNGRCHLKRSMPFLGTVVAIENG